MKITKFPPVQAPLANHIPTEVVSNLEWRKRVHRRVMDDPDYAEVIIDACKRDPIFWINGFGWTYDPRRQPFPKLPFILYPFQVDALLELINATNNHDILVEKSRDMGASWLCVIALAWCWQFRTMQSFLFVSRDEKYVDRKGNPKALFWKFDFLIDNLPQWLRPVGYDSASKEFRTHMHALNPENGSVIDGESTTKKVARGDRRTAILLDEFAAVDQGHSVLSATRDATPCRIFNSTPEGTHNAFYDMRQTNIRKLRLHWTQHPLKASGSYTTSQDGTLDVIDPEGYPEGYTPILDGKSRSPWYDLECERAATPQEIAQELDIDYRGSGYQYFDPSKVKDLIREFARTPTLVGDLDYDVITGEPTSFVESPQGNLRLWFFLDREGNPPRGNYSVGHDVSAGTGASNSTISVWDNATMEKVAEYCNPYIRPEQFAIQAVAIAKWFRGELREEYKNGGPAPGSAYIIWEQNGPGRQFGAKVVELGYADIYMRKREESISKKQTDIPGWAVTKEGKLAVIGAYRDKLYRKLIVNRSKASLDETLEYIFDPRGGVVHGRALNKSDPSGAGASHGDRVMADVLGVHGLYERRVKPKKEDPEIPVGCLAWRNRMREEVWNPDYVTANSELGEGW
jgi:hypothetical protein